MCQTSVNLTLCCIKHITDLPVLSYEGSTYADRYYHQVKQLITHSAKKTGHNVGELAPLCHYVKRLKKFPIPIIKPTSSPNSWLSPITAIFEKSHPPLYQHMSMLVCQFGEGYLMTNLEISYHCWLVVHRAQS